MAKRVLRNPTRPGVKAATAAGFLQPPVFVSISPSSGPQMGGTVVDITVVRAASITGASVGGVALTGFSILNETTIRGTTGSMGSTGLTDVVITNPAGSGTGSSGFTVTVNPPTISSLNYSQGDVEGGGASVIITGVGFTGTTAVSFLGTAAAFTVDNDTQITATLPAHAAGTGNVQVTNPGGSGTIAFEYWEPAVMTPTGHWSAKGATGYTVAGGNGTFLDRSGNTRNLTHATAAPDAGTAIEGHVPPETDPADVMPLLASSVASSTFLGAAALTMWALVKAVPEAGSFQDGGGTWVGCYIMNTGTSQGVGIALTGTGFVPTANGSAKIVSYDGGVQNATVNGLALDTWYLILGTLDAGSLKIYVNGTLGATTPGVGAVSDLTQPLRIMRNANDSVGWCGPFADGGTLNSVISAGNHTKLLKYLRQKFGLALT